METRSLKFIAYALSFCAGTTLADGEAEFDPDFGFDFVTVGDVGNISYPGGLGIPLTGRGAVDYQFRVSRTEISGGQWIQFVNKFGTVSDELGDMLRTGGWSAYRDPQYNGPGQRYVFSAVPLYPERSPVGVSWRQAAMFCNWMHNGCTDDPESLMDGAYDVSTFTRNEDNSYNDQDTHYPGARYWIVTLDEYLKAVYYDPDKNGEGSGWWEFGHSSDEPPVYGMPGVGHVARELSDEQYIELTGGPSHSNIPLGIYTNAQSPWGLLDVLGGETDFVEDWEPKTYRYARARKYASDGSFFDDFRGDRVWNMQLIFPRQDGGFRIASLPRSAADLDRNWKVDWFDVSYFLERYLADDMVVDLNNDQALDGNDVVEFFALLEESL